MTNFLRQLRRRFFLTCEEVNSLLGDYLEGRLDAETEARYEKHIAGCEMCQRYVEQYRETIELAKTPEERPTPPPQFTEATLSFLNEHYDENQGQRSA